MFQQETLRPRRAHFAVLCVAVLSGLVLGDAVRGCSCEPDVEPAVEVEITAAPRPANVIQTYNVLDYGAKCDGSTDDRAAIVKTITAACADPGSGAIVYTIPSANGCIVGKDPANPYGISLPCGDITLQGVRGMSRWKQAASLPNASTPLLVVETQDLVTIDGMTFDGNWGNVVTTITDASNNVALSGTYVINVTSTAGFPAAPVTINVTSTTGNNSVTCTTASTATQFKGCTGGAGVIMRDYAVGYVDANTGINQTTQTTPSNHLVQSLGSTNLTIKNSVFLDAYGDGVWLGQDSSDATKWTSAAKILNNKFTMLANNGVELGGAVIDAQIEGNVITSAFAHTIDAEPATFPTRNVTVRANVLAGWWDPTAVVLLPVQIVQGAGGYGLWGASDTQWKIEHNTINGPVALTGVWNAAFTDNTVLVDCAGNTGTGLQDAPLTVQAGGGDVTVAGNYFYTRAPQSGTDGAPDTGAISIYNVASGSDGSGNNIYYNPVRVRVSDNTIDAQNGHTGIVLTSPGGTVQAVNGTATGTSLTTMTDSLQSWATNQYVGQTVQMGSASAVIASNTSTVLTLSLVNSSTSTAWQTGTTGEYAPTPSSTGAYAITRATGTIDVFDNNITLKNTSGYGAGAYGVELTDTANALPGGRVRIHDNEVKDADATGIHIKFPSSNIYPIVDVYRNYGYDDQATPTMTFLIEVVNNPSAEAFVLGDNIAGESGSGGALIGEVTGLTSGIWLLHDGSPADWAGFGSPAGVVTAVVGSTYRQLDGTGASITWTKQSGTGTSGWLADALQNTAPTFTGVTLGAQSANPGASAPTASNGTVGTGSTDWWGNITTIGATSTVLTFSTPFANRAWCGAGPNGAGTSDVIVVTNSKSAPTFSCFNSTTGIAVNCVDFTYECAGQ